MDNLKTLKEFADELKLDKKRIEYQASKLSDSLVPKLDGIRYLTVEAQMKITEELGDYLIPKINADPENDTLIKHQLEIIKNELQHKNAQLDAKDKQLEQLHKLLAQQQQIQLSTHQQVEQLQQQIQILLNEKRSFNEQVTTKKKDSELNDTLDIKDNPYNLKSYRRKRDLYKQQRNSY